MKQFNGNNHVLHRTTFSSIFVKFALCFLLLGVAYRLFSSSLVQFSPLFLGNDGGPRLDVGAPSPPRVVAEPPPEIADDRTLNLDNHHASENGE